MHDSDLESLLEERSVSPAPRPVLGQIATDPRDIVAPVVVDDQQTTAVAQQTAGLVQIGLGRAPERGPERDEDVRRMVGGIERGPILPHSERDVGTKRLQLSSPDARRPIGQEHVTIDDRAERLDGARDLALAIEGVGQPLGQARIKIDGKVCHGTGSIGRSTKGICLMGLGCADHGDAILRGMFATIRAMPGGIRLFLLYALLILAGIGISMRTVVDQAIAAPVSPLGVLVMILLAYTIFTTTLVLQRKEASRNLAIGLASLIIPAVIILATSPVHPATPFFVAAFGVLLFRGLLRPEVRTWLDQP